MPQEDATNIWFGQLPSPPLQQCAQAHPSASRRSSYTRTCSPWKMREFSTAAMQFIWGCALKPARA